ncbi:unnamed protein product [Urochloa humidicola]
MDQHGAIDEVQYVRGVNWAPDSADEDEDSMAESEVQYVMDTFAGETEVLDSQMDITEVDQADAAHALVQLASTDANTFQSDKVNHEGSSLMLPLIFPRWYGDHEEDVNDAAVSLLWIGRGYTNVCSGLPEIPDQGLDAEKVEETKMSMLKIIFPSMY